MSNDHSGIYVSYPNAPTEFKHFSSNMRGLKRMGTRPILIVLLNPPKDLANDLYARARAAVNPFIGDVQVLYDN